MMISLNPELLVMASELLTKKFKLDNIQNQRIFGLVCGYPLCCIDEYAKNIKGLNDIHALYKAKLRKGDKDPYNLRLKKSNEEGYTITKQDIHHIPCSPYCKKTKKKHEEYNEKWSIFKKHHKKKSSQGGK